MENTRYLIIDPVTRVEGESRVIAILDENSEVSEVYYQILTTRGYESFCIGRAVEDLPRITSTVCGVCSWAHHFVSGKAVDELLGRKPPIPAYKLRELAYYIQIIDSHLLHLGVMALPDFILHDSQPVDRNIIGLIKKEPRLATLLLKTRNLVKEIEKIIGGKPIHASFIIPGGVTRSLNREDVEKINRLLRELEGIVSEITVFFNEKVVKSSVFENYLQNDAYKLETYYMSLVSRDNSLTFYDGLIKIIDRNGREVAVFKPIDYSKYIGEYMNNWSYSKFPYFKPNGWKGFNEESVIRVGPLARLNIVDKIPSEKAGEEYGKILDYFGKKPIHNTIAYHWARVVETIYCIEKMLELLEDPDIVSKETVDLTGEPRYEGVGVIEAPRGILIHHYKADDRLIATHVNIITPTTFNNTAINVELKKVVKNVLKNREIDRNVLNKIEIDIRAYDPCNSCAAHLFNLENNTFKILVIDPFRKEKNTVFIKIT
uniref:Ni/Fe hydrogenase subunit alpha n=1 Tax=Staphylothermus marinus TaxID=2280 RepID=A0A7C4HAZ4_STAMA